MRLLLCNIVFCHCLLSECFAKLKPKEKFELQHQKVCYYTGDQSMFKIFVQVCSKFPFSPVAKYNHSVSRNDKFVFFMFHKTGSASGGLGDRIAGIITAAIFALRTNRTFLYDWGDVSGINLAFEDMNILSSRNANISRILSETKSEDILDLSNCVNPTDLRCALDADVPQRVVIIRTNRAYLCRWATHKELPAYNELERIGINSNTDLMEAAGCVLRRYLSPTRRLWVSVAGLLESYYKNEVKYQLGLHYRCGDANYIKNSSVCLSHPGACCTGRKSYLELILCGQSLLNQRKTTYSYLFRGNTDSFLYIASDSVAVGNRIKNQLKWPNSYLSPAGCHIDINRTVECAFDTISYWFMLALSDQIVMQSVERTYNGYSYVTPASAFSYYAAVYSLKNDAIRYGAHCHQPVQRNASRLPAGNWFCHGDLLY